MRMKSFPFSSAVLLIFIAADRSGVAVVLALAEWKAFRVGGRTVSVQERHEAIVSLRRHCVSPRRPHALETRCHPAIPIPERSYIPFPPRRQAETKRRRVVNNISLTVKGGGEIESAVEQIKAATIINPPGGADGIGTGARQIATGGWAK